MERRGGGSAGCDVFVEVGMVCDHCIIDSLEQRDRVVLCKLEKENDELSEEQKVKGYGQIDICTRNL